MKKSNTICKSCGDQITADQDIMTTLKGAYHKGIRECASAGLSAAPAPRTLAGIK